MKKNQRKNNWFKDCGGILSLMLAVFVLLTCFAGISQADGGIPIFSSPAALDVSQEGLKRLETRDETVVRSRTVLVDMSPVLQADIPAGDERIILNLFDGVNLTAVKDRLEAGPDGVVIWYGHVKDVLQSSVIMVVGDGAMSANIDMPEAHYQIRNVEGAIHSVREIDQSKFKDCQGEPEKPVSLNQAVPDNSGALPDAGTTVDVMVVYSPQAEAATGNIFNDINLAVAETNAAYINSGSTQRVRLAGTPTRMDYTDSGDLGLDLDRITNPSDGYIDGVHGLRNQYAADCVVMLVNDGGPFCGLAWLMTTVNTGFAPTAFAVVALNCATGYYSFGHELGHNMGLRHDCYVDSASTPFNYAHGYVDTANAWRTIMAYNNKCSDLGFNCTRVQYFSNPAVNYLGNPTGDNSGSCDAVNQNANSQLALSNTVSTVINFRQSATAVTDSDGDGVPDVVDSLPLDNRVASPYASTGTGLITVNVTGFGTLTGVSAISDTAAGVVQTGKPSGYEFTHGLVGFTVNGVVSGGDIQVVLTFPAALPAGTKYYKVGPGGFTEYANAVVSGNTVTLTITDNGAGDSNAALGTITDPGGVAISTGGGGGGGGGSSSGGSSGGGGCFIVTGADR